MNENTTTAKPTTPAAPLAGGQLRAPGGPPGVSTLMELHFSLVPSRVLTTAVQLDLFSPLAAGPKTAAEVARERQAAERGVRMLFDALAVLQLLRKEGGRYALSPLAAKHLVRGAPEYAGAFFEQDEMWRAWTQLKESVRTGKPAQRIEHEAHAQEFFPPLIRTLHLMNQEPAKQAARALGAGASHRGLRVLDVACGSGVWGQAIAQADPQARVTAQDFPGVLETTREFVEKSGLQARVDYLPGDLKQVDLGEARFDLAILGHIVHSEGERSSRDLFRRLARALAPGGRVAIIDMIPSNDRSGPPFPVFFALNMLVHTETGDTYTLPEYSAWLSEAGFGPVETMEIGWVSPMLVAARKA